MSDISKTIQPKSDQLNSDDLIAAPMTITITEARVVKTEQPVELHWQGGDGRPYKPSKSMRRIIATAWGVESKEYVGKSMTIYRDPAVKFGGQEVGGIKISHMSHIAAPFRLALTETRGKKALHSVGVLTVRDYRGEGLHAANSGTDALLTWWKDLPKDKQSELKSFLDGELKPIANAQ